MSPMLRFVSLDPTPAITGTLPGAYLVGKDNVAITGEVTLRDGIVVCEKGTSEAAAIAVQLDLNQERLDQLGSDTTIEGVELKPLGTWTLQTCLLPQRENPYLLVLELARHRIMLCLTKLVDWQAIESTEGTLPMRLLSAAQSVFVQALVHAPDSIKPDSDAAKLALRALWIALEASERLALFQAQSDFPVRVNGEMYESIDTEQTDPSRRKPILHPTRGGVVLPLKPAVGTVVSPHVYAPMTQDAITRSCDFITVPMRWIEMEPAEGEYDYTRTDRWIEWAVRKAKVPVVAGPIIDLRPGAVPDWLYIWENDYETLRELIYEHVKNVVTRYRRTIARWTVVSGLHANNNFHLGFDHMMDLTRVCVMVVRKLHPQAKIQVEITQPWGEYYTHNRRSLPPLLYAEMLTQAGISVDSYAVRLQMGQPEQGQSVRDLMEISAMLDRCAMLDRPIALTAVGVPSGTPESVGHPELADRHPGYWRKPWTEQVQADWASAVCTIAMSKPFIQSVCWQELYDLPQPVEMPRGGLISVSGHRKPIVERIMEIRECMGQGKPPRGIADFGVLKGAALASSTSATR